MPKRILYVLNALGGGASLGIYEMLRAWPRDEFEPYAVAPAGRAADLARMSPLFADVRLCALPWWNRDRTGGLLRETARTLGRWRRGQTQRRGIQDVLRAIRDWKIDLVHNGTAVTLCGALAARRANVPHVWHIKECIGSEGRLQFPMDDAALFAYMGSLSQRIIAMSECTARPFLKHGQEHVHVIPDGVDTEPFRNGVSRNLRQRLGVADNELLVGMVASLSSIWKEHDVFIRTAGRLASSYPNARFIMIGPRPRQVSWPHDSTWKYCENLLELAKDVVPPGRVELLDFVPDPPDIMRSLDVLVHPCRTEPFGRIAIEAMAAGTPVVGPQTGGIAETIVHEETGLLVTPGSPEAFATATGALLANPELRHQLGAAGRRRAQAAFSIATHVQRVSDVYRDLLGQPTSGSIKERPMAQCSADTAPRTS